MLSNTFSLLALLPLATAHFVLDWPTNRGFDDEQAVNGPCGGFNDVKSRTEFPLSGGPIQLDMHHTQTKVAVYLALGNDPTSYSITLLPQLAEEGPGDFCLGSVNIPSDLNITSGTNATIQVVSNGDPSGGLYQCADVTLVDTPLSSSDYSANCKNGTNVKVTQENISGNPNGTSSDSPSGTGSPAAASASPTGAAAHVAAGSWFLGGVGMAIFALL